MTVHASDTHRPRWIPAALFFAWTTLLLLPAAALGEQTHGETHAEARAAEAHGGVHAAHAAEGHGAGHGSDVIENWISLSYGPGKKFQNGPFLFALFNFGILCWLFWRYGRRPFVEFLQTRHRTVRDNLAEAAKLRDEAKGKLDAISAKLKHLEREIGEIKEHVAKDAQLEKERILAEARAQADALVKQAERSLDKEILNARRRLESEAVSAAMQAAEKMIRQQINDSDRQRLNEDYFTALASGGKN